MPEKSTSHYVITHGLLKHDGKFHEAGATLELEDEDVKKMDPDGNCFALKSEHDRKAKAAAAAKAILDAPAESAKPAPAAVPGPSAKGGK